LNQKMLSTSQKVVVLADNTKFGRRGLGKICQLEDIDYIITDNKTSDKYISALEEIGIKVIIAEPPLGYFFQKRLPYIFTGIFIYLSNTLYFNYEEAHISQFNLFIIFHQFRARTKR